MRTIRVSALLFPLALAAFSQSIQIERMTEAVVNDRLALATPDQAERFARLKTMFEDAGCGGHLTEIKVKHAKLPNLMCVLPGASDQEVVVGAHFDSVPKVTGVVDNWSGAALLPSLYQSIAKQPRKHTFRFVAFVDEEKGLVGSRAYATALKAEDRARILGMINVDSVGTGPMNVGLNESDEKLTTILRRAAISQKTDIRAVNTNQVGISDHSSFRQVNIPVVSVHSLTNETFPILHSKQDDFAAIDKENYYLTYRVLAIYLVFLDELLK
ncbi:M28 family metallopeptidase [Paludibaculum fermentans]|uniref:M28 family metallopeptidase n=1 Tax=Paludibaculum fermentans TaxID=1473598 RepID=UPI003EBC7D33